MFQSFSLDRLRSLARAGPAWSVLCVAFTLLGCGADPGDRLPAGQVLAGEADGVLPAMERLMGMEGTPVAREAEALYERIADCDLFLARCQLTEGPPEHAEESDGNASCRLAQTAECVESLPAWASALRGDADWIGSWRPPEGLWFLARGSSRDDGSVAIEAEVGPVGDAGAISLLLPGPEPAGPSELADAGALIHLRIRPDGGLNLARFVREEGWAARMYRLKSDLFEGKALAGVWELGVYPPEEGQLMPLVALGIDVRDRELAVEAMEKFLAELEATWPVRRAEFHLGARTGACLGNARVLPDLAPCYVSDADALVVGWNPQSLERALMVDDSASAGRWDEHASAGRVYFSRFPAADGMIARASGAPASATSHLYPWAQLEIFGTRTRGGYRFHVELTAR